MNKKKIYDVIVVGCGASGVAALSRLTERGFCVLGLEADSRIGGRVNSITFGGGIIDMGAEWCHGEENNIVYSTVCDLNILKEPAGENDFVFIDSTGKFLPSEICSKFGGIGVEVAKAISEKMINSDESLGKHFSDEYWQLMKTKYSDVDITLASEMLEWFQKYENSIDACDTWFEASGKGHLEYWECEGNPQLHWNGKGYKTLLDILLKKYPDPQKALPVEIILNKVVKRIIWDSNSNTNVELICADATSYLAKSIITTVSIGVLQEKHSSMFVPQLPESKINTIEGLTIGTVNKMFLLYDKPWWNFKWAGFLWKEEDKEHFTGEDKWLLEVFGVNSSDHNPNLLCGWVSGAASRYMESLPIEKVNESMHRLLCYFLGKQFNISVPVNIIRSTWFTNPYTRGSYTFRSMNSEKKGASAEIMATPILNKSGMPVLCFAGEASSTHYFSTVHGAVEAGFREADRIINYTTNKDEESASQLSAKTNNMSKVLIIGAGISGLSAARTCILAGIESVVVLEARDRCGGRIRSEELEGGFIDYGAQWLHGENNELSHFSKEQDLLSTILSYEGRGRFMRNDGYEFDAEFVNRVDEIVSEILKNCESFSKSDSDCNFSVGEYLENEFEKYISSNNYSEDEIILWKELFKWHIKFQEIDNSCCSLKKLSAKSWGLYDFDGGDAQSHINFKSGYISVVNKLVHTLPDDIIKLESPVSRIFWNNVDNQDTVQVYLSNNECYEANHVIVTIPLGVLKDSHLEMFVPPVPQKHRNTIDSLGFSAIGKIFIQFEEAWWSDTEGFQFVWDLWSVQNEDIFSKEDCNWVKHISGFDVLTVGPPNTLVGWVDSKGTLLMEAMSEEKVTKDCAIVLRHFSGLKELPSIKNMKRTMWNSDPFTRGCYSHITRDCDVQDVGPSTFATPIFNNEGIPVLLFAGEACHSTFFSTTHGAFNSGLTQAKIVCDHILSKNIY